jgi:hypothetical protein
MYVYLINVYCHVKSRNHYLSIYILVKLSFFVKLFRMESRIPLHNFNQRVHLTKQNKRLYDLRYVKLYIKHISICIQYCTRYKWTSSGFWISHDNKHLSNKHTFFCIFSNIDSILFSPMKRSMH